MNPVKFCAIECHHQKSGELSVWDMYVAVLYAQQIVSNTFFQQAIANPFTACTVKGIITPAFIEKLGELVEPQINANGFRYSPVKIGHRILPRDVIEPLKRLCENGTELSPTEWYKEFELIHPFKDGNGRVGAIIFNLLSGSLEDPEIPPNVFGDR